MLLAQSLLFGLAAVRRRLWLGAALMGVGVGLQGVTSTTRFGELMRRLGRGRIGGLTSLAPTTGGIVGAVVGGVVSQRLGTEAGFLMLARGACGNVLSCTCGGCVQRARLAEHRRGDGVSSPSLADSSHAHRGCWLTAEMEWTPPLLAMVRGRRQGLACGGLGVPRVVTRQPPIADRRSRDECHDVRTGCSEASVPDVLG